VFDCTKSNTTGSGVVEALCTDPVFLLFSPEIIKPVQADVLATSQLCSSLSLGTTTVTEPSSCLNPNTEHLKAQSWNPDSVTLRCKPLDLFSESSNTHLLDGMSTMKTEIYFHLAQKSSE
jgi:hypothetical protein